MFHLGRLGLGCGLSSAQSRPRRRALSRLVVVNGKHEDLMSLFDRVRRALVMGTPFDALTGGPLRLRSAVAGASAALVSMLIIALLWMILGVSGLSACVMSDRADRVAECIAESIAAAETFHEELVLKLAA